MSVFAQYRQVVVLETEDHTSATRRVDLKSPRARMVLTLFVVALAGVALTVVLVSHAQTGSARAKAALVALTPVLSSLDMRAAVIVSHPSCDANPPCTSAARTWSPVPGAPRFAELDRALSTWASRNHLRQAASQWLCGPSEGLFGGTGPGCEADFISPQSDRPVYVAVTFIDPAPVQHNLFSNALPILGE